MYQVGLDGPGLETFQWPIRRDIDFVKRLSSPRVDEPVRTLAAQWPLFAVLPRLVETPQSLPDLLRLARCFETLYVAQRRSLHVSSAWPRCFDVAQIVLKGEPDETDLSTVYGNSDRILAASERFVVLSGTDSYHDDPSLCTEGVVNPTALGVAGTYLARAVCRPDGTMRGFEILDEDTPITLSLRHGRMNWTNACTGAAFYDSRHRLLPGQQAIQPTPSLSLSEFAALAREHAAALYSDAELVRLSARGLGSDGRIDGHPYLRPNHGFVATFISSAAWRIIRISALASAFLSPAYAVAEDEALPGAAVGVVLPRSIPPAISARLDSKGISSRMTARACGFSGTMSDAVVVEAVDDNVVSINAEYGSNEQSLGKVRFLFGPLSVLSPDHPSQQVDAFAYAVQAHEGCSVPHSSPDTAM
jgi:hypothetical protein